MIGFIEFLKSIDWLMVSYFLVAAGTLALAVATFLMIRKTEKWNKHNAKMKVLPILSLRRSRETSPEFIDSSHPGWFKLFALSIENVGYGPAIIQGGNAFQGPYKLVMATSTQEETTRILAPSSCQSFSFLITNNFPSLEERVASPPPLEINILIQDLYQREITLKYKAYPLQDENSKYYPIFNEPYLVSMIIGKAEYFYRPPNPPKTLCFRQK